MKACRFAEGGALSSEPGEGAEIVVMKSLRCLLRFLPCLAALGGLVLGAAPPSSAAAKPPTSVSSDYAVLADLSLAQRRAVYRTLDAETQSALWREQIDLYLESHPTLPPRAWLLLTEARDILTPELFADLRWPKSPEYPDAQRAVRALEARARDELSPEDQATLFERIGAGMAGGAADSEACGFLWAVACGTGDPGPSRSVP